MAEVETEGAGCGGAQSTGRIGDSGYIGEDHCTRFVSRFVGRVSEGGGCEVCALRLFGKNRGLAGEGGAGIVGWIHESRSNVSPVSQLHILCIPPSTHIVHHPVIIANSPKAGARTIEVDAAYAGEADDEYDDSDDDLKEGGVAAGVVGAVLLALMKHTASDESSGEAGDGNGKAKSVGIGAAAQEG